MTDKNIAPSGEQNLDHLEALARAATPQNLDSAEDATKPTGYIECPECGGDGTVELTADYCNYDGKAMGVQFYGIGPEHLAAEAFFRAANPAAVLKLIALARRAAPVSAPIAGDALSDEQLDVAAAKAMDQVAAAHSLHTLEMNTDVLTHHTLRRALLRAGAALANQPAPTAAPEQVATAASVGAILRNIRDRVMNDQGVPVDLIDKALAAMPQPSEAVPLNRFLNKHAPKPEIDYSILSGYADKHRLHFNGLCAMVRSAFIAPAAPSLPAPRIVLETNPSASSWVKERFAERAAPAAGDELRVAARGAVAAFDDPTCHLSTVNKYVRDLEVALAHQPAQEQAASGFTKCSGCDAVTHPDNSEPACPACAQAAQHEAGDEAARLRKVLVDVRNSLQIANDSPGGGICDTLWMMDDAETIFDHIDAALAASPVVRAQSEESGIDLAVIQRAYGWVLDNEGQLLGLTAGDMGYEPTGIKLDGTDLEIWKLGAAAYGKQAHAGADEATAELKQVVDFLMGESPLEGVAYGERHPTKAGAFWWRLNLRAALHKAMGARQA